MSSSDGESYDPKVDYMATRDALIGSFSEHAQHVVTIDGISILSGFLPPFEYLGANSATECMRLSVSRKITTAGPYFKANLRSVEPGAELSDYRLVREGQYPPIYGQGQPLPDQGVNYRLRECLDRMVPNWCEALFIASDENIVPAAIARAIASEKTARRRMCLRNILEQFQNLSPLIIPPKEDPNG